MVKDKVEGEENEKKRGKESMKNGQHGEEAHQLDR